MSNEAPSEMDDYRRALAEIPTISIETPKHLPENKELNSVEEAVLYATQKLSEQMAAGKNRPITVLVCGSNDSGKTYFIRRFYAHNKDRFKIRDHNSGPTLLHSALSREEADVLMIHDENAAVRNDSKYPMDAGTVAYIVNERSEIPLEIGLVIYLYNPNLGHQMDEEMRKRADIIVCNTKSVDKIG